MAIKLMLESQQSGDVVYRVNANLLYTPAIVMAFQYRNNSYKGVK